MFMFQGDSQDEDEEKPTALLVGYAWHLDIL